MSVPHPQHGGRLAIVAGRGRLPLDIARAAQAVGEDPFIISLIGEAEEIPPEFERESIRLADGKRLVALIRDRGVNRLILSGGINRRPEFGELRLPWRLLLATAKLGRALVGAGDDKLLRVVISLIESSGCRVIGAQEVVPDLLAAFGPLTSAGPDAAARKDIAIACAGANALGELDVGQGAVAVGGRVVALEGPEGTDAMLDRVARLKQAGRVSGKRKGVLVKLCKPQQDRRADLPSIGPDTVKNAHRAGLAGIALDAGRSFVLDRDAVVREAERAGLFVVGIDRDNPVSSLGGEGP